MGELARSKARWGHAATVWLPLAGPPRARLIRAALTACIAGVIVPACSEEETQPALPERDVFAQSLAAILCEGATDCCSERQLAAPGEGCATEMRNQVFISLLLAEDERQTVTLDTSDSCLDTYRSALQDSQGCDALPHPRDLQTMCPDLFSAVPVGKTEPGGTCDHLYDCSAPEAGDRVCYRLDANAPGVCVWVVPIDPGQSCAAPVGVFTQCPEGQGCVTNATGDDLVCDTASAFGQACVADNSCAVGLLCHDDLCDAPLVLGDPCSSWLEGCEAGTFCDDSAHCQKLPIIAQCESGGCASPLESYCQQ